MDELQFLGKKAYLVEATLIKPVEIVALSITNENKVVAHLFEVLNNNNKRETLLEDLDLTLEAAINKALVQCEAVVNHYVGVKRTYLDQLNSLKSVEEKSSESL